MENTYYAIKPIDVLISSRFLIAAKGYKVNIEPYLFRTYKISNEDHKLSIETELIETSDDVFNPDELFNIRTLTLSYFNAEGKEVAQIIFDVKIIYLEKEGTHSKDEISIYKMKFIITNTHKIKL